jgi:pyruvate/2-oxoglutarate dehydrogenase complex dihydrolipoamide dehydrogenase (E3) component
LWLILIAPALALLGNQLDQHIAQQTVDDRILGFTMIGAAAGEVMAAVQTAMLARLPYQKLRDAALAHPTMAEGLGFLFANVPTRSA